MRGSGYSARLRPACAWCTRTERPFSQDIFDLMAHRIESEGGVESMGIIPEKMKRGGIPENLCPASLLRSS